MYLEGALSVRYDSLAPLASIIVGYVLKTSFYVAVPIAVGYFDLQLLFSPFNLEVSRFLFIFSFIHLHFFKTGSFYVALTDLVLALQQATLEFLAFLMPQPPECWDYWHVPLHQL